VQRPGEFLHSHAEPCLSARQPDSCGEPANARGNAPPPEVGACSRVLHLCLPLLREKLASLRFRLIARAPSPGARLSHLHWARRRRPAPERQNANVWSAACISAPLAPQRGAARDGAGSHCPGRGELPVWYSASRLPRPGCGPPSGLSGSLPARSRTCGRSPNRRREGRAVVRHGARPTPTFCALGVDETSPPLAAPLPVALDVECDRGCTHVPVG
jgi:hypothetical protein